jgi:hypothetical protein
MCGLFLRLHKEVRWILLLQPLSFKFKYIRVQVQYGNEREREREREILYGNFNLAGFKFLLTLEPVVRQEEGDMLIVM